MYRCEWQEEIKEGKSTPAHVSVHLKLSYFHIKKSNLKKRLSINNTISQIKKIEIKFYNRNFPH